MESLILEPTPTAEWLALVGEAERALSITLSAELESYLVFLLMRFAKDPEIVHSVIAIDFLKNLEGLKKGRDYNLREVGDKCLLLAGLFPGRARRSRVRISYFVKLGQSAYSSLSHLQQVHELHSSHIQAANLRASHASKDLISHKSNHESDLFCHLCQHFVGLMDILHTMRELKVSESDGVSSISSRLSQNRACLDLLQAEELWSDTGSMHALKILKEHTQGFVVPGAPSTTKH